MRLDRVVLIGAGNVGWHLGRRFKEKGISVAQVFSRNRDRAAALGAELACSFTDRLDKIIPLDDCLYLLAVKDDSIPEVAAQLANLSNTQRAMAHTSGAVESTVLKEHFENYGVFYPLQTLSRDRSVDFAKIPLCIYGPNQALEKALEALARRLSDQVQVINDQERKILHVAAVFVNNFSNHLFAVGKQIVEKESLSFDLLRPLIAETAAKVMENPPEKMQTGPARRGDQKTILAHLRYLQKHPEFQNLYRLISHSIEKS